MGGSKNKSPAQKEKSQGKDVKDKKSKKSEKSNTTTTSVNINESKATKYINESKIITVQDLARQTDVKISVANSFLKKLLTILFLLFSSLVSADDISDFQIEAINKLK